MFSAAIKHVLKNVVPGINRNKKSIIGTGATMTWFGLWTSYEDFNPANAVCLPITPVDQLNQSKSTVQTRFELLCYKIQKELCDAMEDIELKHETFEIGSGSKQKTFFVDRWLREDGKGGGISCILEDGVVFERAGVNISVIHGNLPPAAVAQMKSRGKDLKAGPDGQGLPYLAVGISSVVHPRNPNVPTMHFNFRYFEVDEWDESKKRPKKTWWFGGGSDLTPYILHDEDATHFHKTLKTACDKSDKTYYSKFKKWCDDYFMLGHRNERRGVGGIFFDDLDTPNMEGAFKFVKNCAESVGEAYLPIVMKRKNFGYGYSDRQWQLLRRGRYVEFNLVHDRGTKFGLFTPGARIESILMSLPSEAKWSYRHSPTPGSREERLMEILKNPKEWVV